MNNTEPAAEIRMAASALWQLFVALRMEGFTEGQALVVLGQSLAANSLRGDGQQ